jgi:hypothetical protein
MKRQKDFFKYIMLVLIKGFVPLRTITLLTNFCCGCPIWWVSVHFTSSIMLQVVDAHYAWWSSSVRFKSGLSNFISNYKKKIGKLTFKHLVTWYNLDGFVVIPLIYETLSVLWFVGTQNSTIFAPLSHNKSIEFLHFEQLDWYEENILCMCEAYKVGTCYIFNKLRPFKNGHVVIGQEGTRIMFSSEHNKFLGFWFLFSMAVNFLHINGGNHFVIVC